MAGNRYVARGANRLSALIGVAAIVIGTGVASAPAVIASAPHAAKPTSVSLNSSETAVKSSTKQALHVAVEASNNPSTPANDTVVVALSKGLEQVSETHAWSFPISSSVLKVATTGAGSLVVPAKNVSPFGELNLKFKPIGKVATKSCQGTTVSKSVKVSLSGVFFFDSMSTGAHKWGTVGSKKSFTFAATNTVTWLFSSAASEQCLGSATPCAPTLVWAAQANGVAFDGVTTNGSSTVRASRAVKLSKPHNAVRTDSNIGPTTQPSLLLPTDESPTLSVSGGGSPATGSATITGSGPATEINTPCGKGGSEITRFFTGSYAKGTPPLRVTEEIYGNLTLVDNSSATVDQTTGV